MKRLLIAGGSHSDIPLIEAARRHGWTIITSGNRPEDLGHRLADETHLEDFSNKEAMLELARRLKIDAICSSANDFSVITSAYVAERLGLPGFDPYETTLTIHHKDRFRALSGRLGLPCPKAKSFSGAAVGVEDVADLAFPLIVKPIDLTGGKGISRVDRPDQLAEATATAFGISRAGRIVVEEYFPGTLHSYSSFIRKQRVVAEHVDNEYCYLNPYLVSTSTAPALVAPEVIEGVRASTERLARELNLVDGILHAQFLVNGTDFRIIEFTRRCPGDLYARPVMSLSGLDHADLIVRPCLGFDLPTDAPATRKAGFFSRHCAMAARPGEYLGIRIDDSIRNNIVDRFDLMSPGQVIDNHLVNKAAIFFLHYRDEPEMHGKNERLPALLKVETRDATPSAHS